MLIRMGASTCVVVSNAAVAKEIFKTHGLNFSSKPDFCSSEYSIYSGPQFIMAKYGDYWRFMRKLCMTKLLGVPQVDRSVNIRDEEIENLVERVEKSSREGRPCDLSGELTTLTNNMICRMAMSTRCSGSENEAEEIHALLKEFTMLAGKISRGDVLGPLKMLDFSGTEKKFVRGATV